MFISMFMCIYIYIYMYIYIYIYTYIYIYIHTIHIYIYTHYMLHNIKLATGRDWRRRPAESRPEEEALREGPTLFVTYYRPA